MGRALSAQDYQISAGTQRAPRWGPPEAGSTLDLTGDNAHRRMELTRQVRRLSPPDRELLCPPMDYCHSYSCERPPAGKKQAGSWLALAPPATPAAVRGSLVTIKRQYVTWRQHVAPRAAILTNDVDCAQEQEIVKQWAHGLAILRMIGGQTALLGVPL